MNELLKRSFFGLLYVLLVLFALQDEQAKSLLLLVFMTFSLVEFTKLVQIHFNSIFFPALTIFAGFFLFSHYENIKILLIIIGFVIITVYTLFIYFIFERFSLDILSKLLLSLIYIAIPFSLAQLIENKLLLSIFIIIWASDTFAFLTGKYFGKHKLAEKISPKKTIEGVVGGLIGSLITGFLLFKFFNFAEGFTLLKFTVLSIIIVIFGTLGDLLESKFKRLAGVKDSGRIIPGHGGILDRLDSFILVIPFVWAYILIVQ